MLGNGSWWLESSGPVTPAKMDSNRQRATSFERERIGNISIENIDQNVRVLSKQVSLKNSFIVIISTNRDNQLKKYCFRNKDDAIIRPLPKVKRILSEPTCLSHIVQLLLTFDPILVEKVACLLFEVMKDNPEISKVYTTGVFFFILMYTGSNVLPIAKFLQLTHMKQAFKSEDVSLTYLTRSLGCQYKRFSGLFRYHAKEYIRSIVTWSDGLLLGESWCWKICADIFRWIWYSWSYLECRNEVVNYSVEIS